jgi:hypothetical protein
LQRFHDVSFKGSWVWKFSGRTMQQPTGLKDDICQLLTKKLCPAPSIGNPVGNYFTATASVMR